MSEGVNDTGGKPALTKEQKKKANLFCIISTICGFLVAPIFCLLCYVLDDNGMESLGAVMLFPAFAAVLAGIGLMIFVRIKYSKSVYGLVLMILYIVMVAAVAIGAIVLIGACLTACTDPTW